MASQVGDTDSEADSATQGLIMASINFLIHHALIWICLLGSYHATYSTGKLPKMIHNLLAKFS